MITFLLGLFGFCDEKILNKFGTCNLFYLPYLWGYNIFLERKYNSLPFGFYCFVGEQGSGKTLSMVYHAFKLKKKGFSRYYSNLSFEGFQHFDKLEELTFCKRSLILSDELGIVANSKTSKDTNSSLLRFSAQNRKNQRLVLTSAQALYMVHKDIRTQLKMCIICNKIGPIVVNRYVKPVIDADGNIKASLPKKVDFFIATKKLYDSYNTLEVI